MSTLSPSLFSRVSRLPKSAGPTLRLFRQKPRQRPLPRTPTSSSCPLRSPMPSCPSKRRPSTASSRPRSKSSPRTRARRCSSSLASLASSSSGATSFTGPADLRPSRWRLTEDGPSSKTPSFDGEGMGQASGDVTQWSNLVSLDRMVFLLFLSSSFISTLHLS
ncbi:hypothetical protein FA10DRAFT_86087 [Acaromyces ingoldii]|uniref:Uncharacterized protein n=1 Tax=Acaromyces ingoldii TaxID=215250 RepID=A0A316YT16_9BASI|nr:hypothetical protein FA10DRAFT_86087 [Acaromyces ingoldii]PWN92176.1 hypothetical protein FA10DRAFT_86087 [Acaromyces ingoldii]